MSVVLPELAWRHTPNFSSRHASPVDLLVWHETQGSYEGAVDWLCNPQAQASAHLVIREDGLEATQLVKLSEKAWHAAAFNSRSVGVEHANVRPQGYASREQLAVSARVFGWLCLRLQIPPRWARGGLGRGVCYHGELGAAGGGHYNCGPDPTGWQSFLTMLHAELARGGFREYWAQ